MGQSLRNDDSKVWMEKISLPELKINRKKQHGIFIIGPFLCFYVKEKPTILKN